MYHEVTERPRQVAVVAITGIALGVAIASASDWGGRAALAVVLVGGGGGRSRGVAGLVGWIVGGALLGGAAGYAATSVVQLPLSAMGAVGLGIALGGGVGGISHLLSTEDPAALDDEQVTVDMASDDTAEPRPADLFEEHPDPLLFVTDAGAGPVVRAANDAYERAFDLPATTVEDAPLGDVLVTVDAADGLVDSVAAGDAVDAVVAFETPDGERSYRVRSVGAAGDGYLLFTPVDAESR